MMFLLIPALALAVAGAVWWLVDVVRAVPRRNADFGAL